MSGSDISTPGREDKAWNVQWKENAKLAIAFCMTVAASVASTLIVYKVTAKSPSEILSERIAEVEKNTPDNLIDRLSSIERQQDAQKSVSEGLKSLIDQAAAHDEVARSVLEKEIQKNTQQTKYNREDIQEVRGRLNMKGSSLNYTLKKDLRVAIFRPGFFGIMDRDKA